MFSRYLFPGRSLNMNFKRHAIQHRKEKIDFGRFLHEENVVWAKSLWLQPKSMNNAISFWGKYCEMNDNEKKIVTSQPTWLFLVAFFLFLLFFLLWYLCFVVILILILRTNWTKGAVLRLYFSRIRRLFHDMRTLQKYLFLRIVYMNWNVMIKTWYGVCLSFIRL